MDFYTIVIIIATCFLIVCLIIMGLIMQNMNVSGPFPPVANPCPDNWEVQGNACLIGVDKVNTGTIASNITGFLNNTYGIYDSKGLKGKDIKNPLDGTTKVNFSDPEWGDVNLCSKKKWANIYSITWDGVTNNTGC